MYDVVVVGGGPIGSRTAYQLAGKGYAVAVLEQKETLGQPVCCTGIISRECVSAFGIDVSLISSWANSARIFSPSGKRLDVKRPEPQACVLDRAAFDLALADQARASGAQYLLDSHVTTAEVRADGVRIEATHRDGSTDFIEAKAAVIANGFSTKEIKGLHLDKAADFVMGAQAEVETTGIEEVEVYFGQEIAPGFFAWLVPTKGNKALAGLMSRRNPRLYLRKFLSSLLAQQKIVSTEVEMSYRGIPLKPLTKTYGKRLVVVGSAAGQVKPTTGGGIYYGLLCADIAANTLHRALQNDDLTARNLSVYEREWKKKLAAELKTGYWARKFYEHLSDSQIDGIFGIIIADGIADTLLKAGDISFDWHSQVLRKLIGPRAISKAIGAMALHSFSRSGG